MVRLNWNAAGERRFETGVDRGVLYLSGIPGVPWNGLTAVNEAVDGGSIEAYYLDGVKYLNVLGSSEFEAKIDAFSSPREFSRCEGSVSLAGGLSATQQPSIEFGLSYRTLVGNDLEGAKAGYKIHLVYNITAEQTDRSHSTVSDSPEAATLSWNLHTRPEKLAGTKPTAHLVIDSTATDRSLLEVFEGYIYGHDGLEPRLPPVTSLLHLFTFWYPFPEEPAFNFLGRTEVAPSGGSDGDAWIFEGELYYKESGVWQAYVNSPMFY